MANSPTLEMGLLMFDPTQKYPSYSPEQSLSHAVAPFTFNENFRSYDFFISERDDHYKKSVGLNDDLDSIDALMNEFLD